MEQALMKAQSVARDYLDVDGLLEVAKGAPAWTIDAFPDPPRSRQTVSAPVRIGVLKDAAFQFYYSENILALSDRGAKIVEISALSEKALPPVDALYIGGGFPETQAQKLAANVSFARSVRDAAQAGLPIYAECGGFIYLGEALVIGNRRYPMVGALPVQFRLEKKPQGHGYTTVVVDRENPFFPIGQTLTGHEFHYCRVLAPGDADIPTAYYVLRGTGMGGGRDGLCKNNILAGFTHLHALGTPAWAGALVSAAEAYRAAQTNQPVVLKQDRIPSVLETRREASSKGKY